MDVLQESLRQKERLIGLRRSLHQNAEVGLELPETMRIVAQELKRLGVAFSELPGGIRAALGRDGGKRILLRADMDALPIQEKTGLEFASKNPGTMHACGHDLHASMLLGAAALLKAREAELDGQVILLFQAGEECAEGARAMIESGILEPRPDYAAAVHIAGFAEYPTGIVAVNTGPVYASRDEFMVTVTGAGGHGAEPHKAKNPIYCAVKLIETLTDMTRYELDANIPAVLTVCQISAGSAPNVIPETCRFGGTLRMADGEARRSVLRRMEEIVSGICTAYCVQGELRFTSSLPMLVNDGAFAAQVYTWLSAGLPGATIAPPENRFSMGSEDFSLITEQIPSAYLYILSQSPPGRHYPEHHEKVVFDDEAVPVGAAVYAQIALSYLKPETASEE